MCSVFVCCCVVCSCLYTKRERVCVKGAFKFDFVTSEPGHLQMCPVFHKCLPVPRVLWHGRTELTEVPGTGISAAQKSHIFLCG